MDYVIKDTDLTAIANAIRSKNGSSDTYTVTEMADEIGNIGLQPEEKDVDFIDYDGTLIYSYTAEEFLAMTKMPPNPQHEGLLAQGWNWTLADAKEYVEDYGKMNIGQMYVTDDGRTRIHIHAMTNQDTILRFSQTVANGVTVNWGDGSATETYSGTSATSHAHRYSTVGNYTITLEVTAGKLVFTGTADTTGYSVYGQRASQTDIHSGARNSEIIGVNIGSNVQIGQYSFYGCYSLAELTIPSDVTSIGAYAFNSCYRLVEVTIPSSVISIGESAFRGCSSLIEVSFSTGITSIPAYMLNGCSALSSLTIPTGVTSIGANAFYGLNRISEMTIPYGVTSVGDSAFSMCYSLVGVTIPTTLTSFGAKAFYLCYSLTEVTVPSGTTTIPANMCYNCYSLTKVTIPSSVTTINANAFANCPGVGEFHILPTTPPTLAATSAFPSVSMPGDKIFYVPYSADHSILEAYQTATNWSTYASYMQEEPQS